MSEVRRQEALDASGDACVDDEPLPGEGGDGDARDDGVLAGEGGGEVGEGGEVDAEDADGGGEDGGGGGAGEDGDGEGGRGGEEGGQDGGADVARGADDGDVLEGHFEVGWGEWCKSGSCFCRFGRSSWVMNDVMKTRAEWLREGQDTQYLYSTGMNSISRLVVV